MAKERKILICAYCVDRDDVGEAKMGYELVKRLANYAKVWLITSGSRFRKDCGLEGQNNIELIKLRPYVSFKWWDSFDRAAHPGYLEFFIRAGEVVKELLRRETVDIGHHLSPYSPRYPSPLIDFKIPLVVGPIYGGLKPPAVMGELGEREGWLFKLRVLDRIRMLRDPLLKKHYDQAQRIILSAPYVRELLPNEYWNKCVVVTGIGTDYQENISTNRGTNSRLEIMYVGRIVPSKGLELLIEALGKLKTLDFRLSLYGHGPQELHYKMLAERLGILRKIDWKGFVANENVRRDFKKADIFAFPSLKEPAGIAVLEAMAAGLPVVCVDYGGPAYSIADDCGVKIPLGTKQQMVNNLAEEITRLANSPQLRFEMGQNAIKRVKAEFGWDSITRKTLGVYDEVMRENSR